METPTKYYADVHYVYEHQYSSNIEDTVVIIYPQDRSIDPTNVK